MVRAKRPTRRDAGRPRGAVIAAAVLSATLDDLAEAGLEGLSVERIARRADVNKTSIYRRWPTREAMVAAALEGILAGVEAQLPDTGTLKGDLIGLALPVAMLASEPRGRALVRAALAESSTTAVAALAASVVKGPGEGAIGVLVARAEARGEWRAGASGELLIVALAGAILHRAMLERAPVTERWLADLVDQLLLGVLRRS